METEAKVSKVYIIGFNHGYILAKNDPLLLSELQNKKGDTDYLKGIEAGELQFRKELKIEELKGKFKSGSLEKKRGLGR